MSRSKEQDYARADERTAAEHRTTLTAMRDQFNSLLAGVPRGRHQRGMMLSRRDALDWALNQIARQQKDPGR